MPSDLSKPNRRLLVLRVLLGLLAALLLIGVAKFHSPWKVGLDRLTMPEAGAKLADFINAGEWVACLVNGILCAILAATVPWWIGAFPPIAPGETPPRPWWKRVLASRWLWVTGIVLFGAFLTPAVFPTGGEFIYANRNGFFGSSGLGPAESFENTKDWALSRESTFLLIALSSLLVLVGAVSWLVLPLGKLDDRDEGAAHRVLAPPRAWTLIFYLLLLVIIGVAGWMRAPRLDHSLWNDEEYSLRRYVWGYQKVRTDDTLKLDRVTWPETFFYNRGANNHIPHSITSRLALEIWSRAVQQKGDDRFFSERAYRLPVYLAGLLGICVLAILLADMGLAPVGLTAAVLLTLHPWHLRYSVEARGYSWMLLFLLLAMFCLHRALAFRGPAISQSPSDSLAPPRWRFWLGYGLCQFLYLWSFPGAIYVAVVMNALVFGWLVWEHRAQLRRPLETPLSSFLVVNLASGMLFLQAMAPSIPQIRLYLQRDIAEGEMNADWWRDIGSHLVSGVQWKQPLIPAYELSYRTQLANVWNNHFLEAAALCVIPLVLLGGVAFLVRKRQPWGLILLAPVLSAFLAYVHTRISGNFLFSWYIIYALPSLCALLAAAPALPIQGGEGTPGRRSLSAGISLVLLAIFLALTIHISNLVRLQPRQRLDVASPQVMSEGEFMTQSGPDGRPYTPEESAILHSNDSSHVATSRFKAVFGVSAEQFRSYVPQIRVLKSGDDLRQFVCEAQKAGDWPVIVMSGVNRAKVEDADTYKALMTCIATVGANRSVIRSPEAMFDLELIFLPPLPALCSPSLPPEPK